MLAHQQSLVQQKGHKLGPGSYAEGRVSSKRRRSRKQDHNADPRNIQEVEPELEANTLTKLELKHSPRASGCTRSPNIVVQTLIAHLLAGGCYYCNPIAFIIVFPKRKTAALILPSLKRTGFKPAARVI